MEEELHERPLYRRFAGLDGAARMPDETNILCFRHLLEKHQLAPQVLAAINTGRAQQGLMLKTGTIVDATIIAAPSSTKNKEGERDPEMHQPKKGNQWHYGMKAHIGVDADSGLVHTVIGTAANVNDVTQAAGLLHGKDKHARGDAGYQGVDKRQEMQGSKAKAKIKWQVASGKWPCARASAKRSTPTGSCTNCWRRQRLKASVRAKVEHPFRVIKQQFGYAKVRYRGLEKNTARLTMLFAQGNLWMTRKRIMALQG